jgi:hypothetical protein
MHHTPYMWVLTPFKWLCCVVYVRRCQQGGLSHRNKKFHFSMKRWRNAGCTDTRNSSKHVTSLRRSDIAGSFTARRAVSAVAYAALNKWRHNGTATISRGTWGRTPAVPTPLRLWSQSSKRYVTRDTTMETAAVSDIYCKWTNTNAFCWTLHDSATYLKNIEFLMLGLLVKSNTFWESFK